MHMKERDDSHIKNDHDNIPRKYRPLLKESDVYYMELANRCEMDYVELYLINRYKPLANVQSKNEGTSELFLCNLPEWIPYRTHKTRLDPSEEAKIRIFELEQEKKKFDISKYTFQEAIEETSRIGKLTHWINYSVRGRPMHFYVTSKGLPYNIDLRKDNSYLIIPMRELFLDIEEGFSEMLFIFSEKYKNKELCNLAIQIYESGEKVWQKKDDYWAWTKLQNEIEGHKWSINLDIEIEEENRKAERELSPEGLKLWPFCEFNPKKSPHKMVEGGFMTEEEYKSGIQNLIEHGYLNNDLQVNKERAGGMRRARRN